MPSSPIPKPGSVEWGAEKAEDETRIRRSALSPDKLITQPWEGIDTVYDVLEYAARTHGTKNAYGYRNVVDIHEEEKEVKKVVGGKEITEKKTWKYFQLSEYKYLSFEQVKEAAREIAGGLLELGVQKTDVVNVYAATRCVPLCSSPSFLPQCLNAPMPHTRVPCVTVRGRGPVSVGRYVAAESSSARTRPDAKWLLCHRHMSSGCPSGRVSAARASVSLLPVRRAVCDVPLALFLPRGPDSRACAFRIVVLLHRAMGIHIYSAA